MTIRKLSLKQLKFIEAYAGNGAEAARIAGYAGDAQALAMAADRLMRDDEIRQAIDARMKPVVQGVKWDREKLQEFWIGIADDPKVDLKHRLKASELLGRSQAIFTDNVNLKNTKPTSITFIEVGDDDNIVDGEVVRSSER